MESTGWAVIHCLAPEPAEETLERLGYTVYLPRFKARLIGVRIVDGHRIRTRGLGSIIERVLFPQYLFVLWRDGLRERPINVAGGYLLRHPPDDSGQAWPKLLTVELVDELRRRVADGEFDQTGPKPRRWVNIADPELLERIAAGR
jgi:hypothetical protein